MGLVQKQAAFSVILTADFAAFTPNTLFVNALGAPPGGCSFNGDLTNLEEGAFLLAKNHLKNVPKKADFPSDVIHSSIIMADAFYFD